MRVGLNAWFWDQPHTGSGQYLRRLVGQMAALEPGAEILLVAPCAVEGEPPGVTATVPRPFLLPSENLRKVWFEQVAFPRACRRHAVDVAHVPYWAAPAAPSCPTAVTIHDLIPLLLPAYRGGPAVRGLFRPHRRRVRRTQGIPQRKPLPAP